MSRRALVHQSEIIRTIKAAIKGGLPLGSFTVEVVGDAVRLLPIAANAPLNEAGEMERRMKDAFGE